MNRLKKELEQLKRENKRLRKQLRLQEGAGPEPFEDEEDAEKETSKPRPSRTVKKGAYCAKCKEPAEEREIGPFTYLWCSDPKCNHRRKLK